MYGATEAGISQGDQFADIIDEGLKRAELLVVVMSPNWMHAPVLPQGVRDFSRACAKPPGSPIPRRECCVVGKGYVDRRARPPELQGQEGFLFYSRDDQNDVNAISAASAIAASATNDSTVELDALAGGLQKRVARPSAARPRLTPPQGPLRSSRRMAAPFFWPSLQAT